MPAIEQPAIVAQRPTAGSGDRGLLVRNSNPNFSSPQGTVGSILTKTMSNSDFRLDKTLLSKGSHDDNANGWEYWLSRTPEERFAALEFMRQINYDYDPDTERIPRVLEVVKREKR